jgi:hypothetical protein
LIAPNPEDCARTQRRAATLPSAPMEKLFEDVYTDTRRAKFFGVECGSRMTVIKLDDGGLFIHSPVALDAATRASIDALGEVRAVVSPSIFHHLHVRAWMDAYPGAHFAACPGLEWKRPDLAFHSILGDVGHPLWRGALEQVYFSARRENEVVFYFAKRKLFICADALLNISTLPQRDARLVARLIGNTAPGVGWLEPFMIRDRRLARRQADRILEWDFDRAILSHGAPVERDAHAVFRRAYARF